MPLDKSWTNVILIVRWKDSVIVIEINRCPSVFLCDERRHRGGIQSQIDGWKHDSSRHPLSDKETQPRSWTLTKQLVRRMLNITERLLQHLKSVPSSVPRK